VTCFQYHGQQLLIGQEAQDCIMCSFVAPNSGWGEGGLPPRTCSATSAGGGPEGEGDRGGAKGRKKGTGLKVPAKKNTKYPKRRTR
jgi:hypothetical protein